MLTLTKKAISIIDKNFPMLSGVDELADMLGVTKHHLIRVFKAETGSTPGGWLEYTRIRYAKILLAHRNYSIETTAQIVGYSGANYFCKVFRRAVGETPASFRARQSPAALPPKERAWLDITDKHTYT